MSKRTDRIEAAAKRMRARWQRSIDKNDQFCDDQELLSAMLDFDAALDESPEDEDGNCTECGKIGDHRMDCSRGRSTYNR